jgi:hypothetical protein
MADTHRVMIRLSPALYAQLAARGSSGQPLAAIVRQALVEYLSRQPAPAQSAVELATAVAALAARVDGLQDQVEALAARLERGAAPQQPQQPAGAAPAAATRAQPQQPEPPSGDPRGAMRRRILGLLQAHPDGLTTREIRDRLGAERSLADTLAGMRRYGLVQRVGRGRYVAGA